jgi:hypothetical protein
MKNYVEDISIIITSQEKKQNKKKLEKFCDEFNTIL